jgi:hypothetical protein
VPGYAEAEVAGFVWVLDAFKMKKIFLLSLSLTLYSTSLWAQFARIDDKDGYVNIRSKPGTSSSVLIKAIETDVFYCFEREGEWYPVDLERAGKVISGYIHNSRVKFIDSLDSVPVEEATTNRIVFKNENIRVEIITEPFLKSAHVIQYDQATRLVRLPLIINQSGAQMAMCLK